ncbi:MAG TPA: hypothetical protein PLH33_06425, partial [Chitinophagaceae bacterium]|nr:hypothetical protein [Chitinophagaceae bacterium]
LEGVQKILSKSNISTIIRPKSNEDCYLIEFSNELDIYNFYKMSSKTIEDVNVVDEAINILEQEPSTAK